MHDRNKKLSKRREAAKFKSPEALERERKRLSETPDLPGFEVTVPIAPRETPRSDQLWRNAEASVGHVLLLGRYQVRSQVRFGRAYGSDMIADFICNLPWAPEDKILISVKWLRAGGSWDRKIPDDVMTWDKNIPYDGVNRGYVVIVGPGLSVKKKLRWVDGHEIDTQKIIVLDYDTLSARAWCWKL